MISTTTSADLHTVRWALHAITFALLIVTTVRAIVLGANPWLVVACSVAFLGTYIASSVPSAREKRLLAVVCLVVLTVVWFVSLVVSPEFVWLLFPLILLGGHFLPVSWAAGYTAAVITASVVAPVIHGDRLTAAGVIGPAIGGLFALGIARGAALLLREAVQRKRLIASLVQSQDEMAALQDELVRSQRDAGATAERTRLSRDLHDTIAQDLSSIALLARSAQGDGSELAQIESLARSALEDTRRIVHALAPADLEDGALVDAMRRIAARFAATHAIDVTLTADASLPTLGSAVDVALLRTLQSGIANVAQHASASRVSITVTDMGDEVRLDIADDGIGFDISGWERTLGTTDSYGLAAMRSRLRELGGGLDIESESGRGTVLSAHVPFAVHTVEAS